MKSQAKHIQIVDNDEMLRRMGVVRRVISETGFTTPNSGGDWLETLLFSSAPVQNRLNEILQELESDDTNETTVSCEVLPGLWMTIFSRNARRGSAATVAMFVTSESFSASQVDSASPTLR